MITPVFCKYCGRHIGRYLKDEKSRYYDSYFNGQISLAGVGHFCRELCKNKFDRDEKAISDLRLREPR